jgi:D-arabinitol 2-dehydrogenase
MSSLKLSLRSLRPLTCRPCYRAIKSHRFSQCAIRLTSKHDKVTTSQPPKTSGQQEGETARTDERVHFEHPDPSKLPSSEPVRGHGGRHFKPTLASFSLERKVAVITGGARGLGLVMAQALMTSGAEIALVDLDGKVSAVSSRVIDINNAVMQRPKPRRQRRRW